ncbi:MAG TPA: MBL fold metallo-hydrolase [Actinomycetota bacterium]|nr:MBL fold metallo-hydrolase [Actinomycetota bacterium]
MPHVTVEVGVVRITALLDADIDGGPMDEAFPGLAPERLRAETERSPGETTGDSWHLRVRAWLLVHPAGVLLFDTGLGPATAPAAEWASSPGALLEALAEVNTTPEHVDLVALSHVHDDHVGGVVTETGDPTFPRARYLVQRADAEWLAEDPDNAQIREVLFAPLERAGVLELLDGDHGVSDRLELHHVPGHTPGHQILRVAGDGDRALLSADTWNHPMQLSSPDVPSGPDHDRALAAAARRTVLAEALNHPGTLIAPTHFADAFGRLGTAGDGSLRWEPLED